MAEFGATRTTRGNRGVSTARVLLFSEVPRADVLYSCRYLIHLFEDSNLYAEPSVPSATISSLTCHAILPCLPAVSLSTLLINQIAAHSTPSE